MANKICKCSTFQPSARALGNFFRSYPSPSPAVPNSSHPRHIEFLPVFRQGTRKLFTTVPPPQWPSSVRFKHERPWDGGFICFFPGCVEKFNKPKDLEDHYAENHPELKLHCNCGASFKDGVEMQKHGCVFRRGENFGKFCERMNYLFNRYKKPTYECMLCHRRFPSAEALHKHHSEKHVDGDDGGAGE